MADLFFSGTGSDAELLRKSQHALQQVINAEIDRRGIAGSIAALRSSLAIGSPAEVRQCMLNLVSARGFFVDTFSATEIVGVCAQHLPELAGIEYAAPTAEELRAHYSQWD